MINISFFHATNRICIQPLYITKGEDRCVISMTADLRERGSRNQRRCVLSGFDVFFLSSIPSVKLVRKTQKTNSQQLD